jgi:transposase-like protein
MTNNLEIAKINAAVDLLIESDVDLSNALGKDGLIKQLSKRILERALEAEMDNHLGYSRYDRSNIQNARNGEFQKNLVTCPEIVTVILSRLSLKRSKVE